MVVRLQELVWHFFDPGLWTLLLSLLRRFSMTSMLQKGSCVPKKRILQSPLSVVLGVAELVNAWFNAEVAVISGYHKLPCFLFVIKSREI